MKGTISGSPTSIADQGHGLQSRVPMGKVSSCSPLLSSSEEEKAMSN